MDQSSCLASLVSTAREVASSTAASSSKGIDYHALSTGIIGQLPEESEKIRKGNKKVLMRLVGEGMKQTSGKADVGLLRKALEKALQ